MKICDWLNLAICQFYKSSNPKLDAEILLSFVTKKSKSWLFAFQEKNLTEKQIHQLMKFMKERIEGKPISYLIKKKEFWSLSFTINKNTFIPRNDTEILVEKTLLHLSHHSSKILDLGTGCGSIAIAIAKERPDCFVLGVDRFKHLINLAEFNSYNLKIYNTRFLYSNWFSKLKNNFFNIIVSNPPYIDIKDPHLNKGDLRFEPLSALISHKNGLGYIEYIIKKAKYFIYPKGWLILEHGWTQARDVQKIFFKNNYSNIFTYKDYAKNNRVTIGKII